MNSNTLLFLGFVAGATIFLGLPIAFLRRPHQRLRSLLNAFSVGVLIFLLIEIGYEVLEKGETIVFAARIGKIPLLAAARLFVPLMGGLFVGFWGLVWFDRQFIKTAKDESVSADRRARHVALMIAVGIGLHNLGEGLAIGSAYATGALSLAKLLILGFALHNATEGFGIAGPLGGSSASLRYVFLLGCIGGLPTMLGTFVGAYYASTFVRMVFMALACGSILYVVGELLHLGRHQGVHEWVMAGLLLGFFSAYGTELVIASAAPEEEGVPLVLSYPTEKPSAARGATLYAESCVSCHGVHGDGKGPAAAKLPRAPTNFTDSKWVVLETDEDWFDLITYGMGTDMPPWKDLLTDQERWDLVAYLRTLAGSPPREASAAPTPAP